MGSRRDSGPREGCVGEVEGEQQDRKRVRERQTEGTKSVDHSLLVLDSGQWSLVIVGF